MFFVKLFLFFNTKEGKNINRRLSITELQDLWVEFELLPNFPLAAVKSLANAVTPIIKPIRFWEPDWLTEGDITALTQGACGKGQIALASFLAFVVGGGFLPAAPAENASHRIQT